MKMKRTCFSRLLILALVLGLAAVSCRKSPDHMRTIYGQAQTNPEDITQGTPFPPEGVDTNATSMMTPLAEHEDRSSWTRNAEIFKAYSVHFDYDSAALKSSERAKIVSVADYLKGNAQVAVLVEGNCDERGTEEYNRSLGERRALAAREELIRLGLPPVRVDTKSWGEDNPANNPGHDESAWRENRRGDFILLTPP
jgi:peptidoglycan-associated lipoprotein